MKAMKYRLVCAWHVLKGQSVVYRAGFRLEDGFLIVGTTTKNKARNIAFIENNVPEGTAISFTNGNISVEELQTT